MIFSWAWAKSTGHLYQVAGLFQGAQQDGAQGRFVFNKQHFHKRSRKGVKGNTARRARTKDASKFVFILCVCAYRAGSMVGQGRFSSELRCSFAVLTLRFSLLFTRFPCLIGLACAGLLMQPASPARRPDGARARPAGAAAGRARRPRPARAASTTFCCWPTATARCCAKPPTRCARTASTAWCAPARTACRWPASARRCTTPASPTAAAKACWATTTPFPTAATTPPLPRPASPCSTAFSSRTTTAFWPTRARCCATPAASRPWICAAASPTSS